MHTGKAMLAGGVGGVLPGVVSMTGVGDPAAMLIDLGALEFAGLMVKYLGLAALGVFMVWINHETDLKKAAQLGLLAPVIAVGWVNGAQLNQSTQEIAVLRGQLQQQQSGFETQPNALAPTPARQGFGFSLISPAMAGDTKAPPGLHRKPSDVAKFWYGMTGLSKRTWFVIAGSHRTEAAAAAQAKKLRDKGYDARVFPPFASSQYFGVMIGSWLGYQEAKAIKARAIDDGLPRDTYLWRLPR